MGLLKDIAAARNGVRNEKLWNKADGVKDSAELRSARQGLKDACRGKGPTTQPKFPTGRDDS